MSQYNEFCDHLVELMQVGMIGNVVETNERSIRRRMCVGFDILNDATYKKTNNHLRGVQSGRYSGNDYEIASVGSMHSSGKSNT